MENNINLNKKWSASSFRFGATNYQNLGSFTAKIYRSNGKAQAQDKYGTYQRTVSNRSGHVHGT